MINGRCATGRAVPEQARTAATSEMASDRDLLGRFAALRDEQAFAELVRRHGPMVFSVCRRILDSSHDAEDAFQATFVVLARKAHALTKPELLANWLYGVAYRTARKARAQSARRGHYERQAMLMSVAETLPPDDDWQDIRAILDEELQHLPPKYRAPLVLCYLEGMTNEEAARRLGWPAGSMSYRLARGRELLRNRLLRRDRALPLAGLPQAEFDSRLAALALPAVLSEPVIQATVKAALGDAGRPNLKPAVLALAGAGRQPMSPRVTVALAAVLIAITMTALGVAGAQAFGFNPIGRLLGSPSPSSTIGAPPGCCHVPQPN